MDPFLYAEHDGRAFAVVSALDADGIAAARPGIEIVAPEALGIDELLASGAHRDTARLGVVARACGGLAPRAAAVPPAFPVGVADHLRAAGVEPVPDRELFEGRRRAKNE